MFSYECSVCHGQCDPGELEGGICYECRSNTQDERNSKNLDKRMRERYAEQPDGQKVMAAN